MWDKISFFAKDENGLPYVSFRVDKKPDTALFSDLPLLFFFVVCGTLLFYFAVRRAWLRFQALLLMVAEVRTTIRAWCTKCFRFRDLRQPTRSSASAAAPQSTICPICSDANINVAFVPCGHTFCSLCASRLRRSGNCPICRVQVQSEIRIYI